MSAADSMRRIASARAFAAWIWRSRSRRTRRDMRLVGGDARAAAHRLHLRAAVPDALDRAPLADRLLVSNADPDTCDRDPRMFVMHEVDQVLALAPARRRDRDRSRPAHRDQRLPTARPSPTSRPTRSSSTRAALDASTAARPASLLELFRRTAAARAAARRDVRRRRGRTGRARCASAGVADRVVGGLTFGQWAAAFERAACIVTIDTGATHVASAVQRPTVVLFEHAYFRLNSQEWSPYRVPNAVLRKPPTDAPAALAGVARRDRRGGCTPTMTDAA